MKIYIVSFQSKENNETKNTYLFWTRAVVSRAGQEGPLWPRRKHLIFSGAFSSGARLRPFSGVSVQDLTWSVCVSQFEKGSCFLFLLSHSKGRHSKTPKTNKQKPHQNQALGCLGAWTCWFSSGSGVFGKPTWPPAAAAAWTETTAHVSSYADSSGSCLLHHCFL